MKASLNILAAFLSLVGLVIIERSRTADLPHFGLIGTVALVGAVVSATLAALLDRSDEESAEQS